MAYADKTLTCRDCGAQFQFTAREQEFYASKGFENEPSRCPDCRAAKQRRPASGNRRTARSDGDTRTMYPAVCAACGAQTQVPFVPKEDRPVFCSNCFSQRRKSRY
ncbi:MAG: zinc-ribbon domain containing protein [Chloroflexi bacterium]|nr:zinc-ribbon domain containing protein [Chloroflexota bacterium]